MNSSGGNPPWTSTHFLISSDTGGDSWDLVYPDERHSTAPFITVAWVTIVVVVTLWNPKVAFSVTQTFGLALSAKTAQADIQRPSIRICRPVSKTSLAADRKVSISPPLFAEITTVFSPKTLAKDPSCFPDTVAQLVARHRMDVMKIQWNNVNIFSSISKNNCGTAATAIKKFDFYRAVYT